MTTLRWLLSSQLKRSKPAREIGGFTIIELLVGLLLAFLVLIPLLGFMVDVLNNDRKEQAKATSEQEIQSALDYIDRDLQQAAYIYDGNDISTIQAQLPGAGKSNQIPVLVFWKRKFIKQALLVPSSAAGGTATNNDSFVYSLVAYYLVTPSLNNGTWSSAAQIGRYEISDGVRDSNGGTCPGYTDTYAKNGTTTLCPDPGFQLFQLTNSNGANLTGGIRQKMDAWTKNATNPYTQPIQILVDYIDPTSLATTPRKVDCNATLNSISPSTNTVTETPLPSFPGAIEQGGFFACVNSINSDNRSVAQVYLRGNALARLQPSSKPAPLYSDGAQSYFPTANVRVEGRSFIFTK